MTQIVFDPRRDRIRMRIFPADVLSEKRNFAQVLALVTQDAVYIYQDGRPAPQMIFGERLDDIQSVNGGTELCLASGETMLLRKGGGCGCTSRLRHWSPPTPNLTRQA